MRKLSVFNQVTVDGFFTDLNNDMSWAHQGKRDKEWQDFVAGNAASGGTLLFGRVTYEMMASYWPTPQASKDDPKVAKGMNESQKVVFSRSLDAVAWSNTKLVKTDLEGTVRKLKSEAGSDMVVLGSGSIVSQLAQANLIDELTLVVNPLALGQGKTLFAGVQRKLPLQLTQSRSFGNGCVVLSYQLAR